MAWSTLKEFTDWGLPPHAIWDGQWESIEAHLNAAQSDIEEAFRTAGETLPIPVASVPPGVKRRECVIAGYNFLRVRGWEVGSEEDKQFVKEYERCLKWLEAVAEQKTKALPEPQVTDPQNPTTAEPSEVAVYSEPARGWGAL